MTAAAEHRAELFRLVDAATSDHVSDLLYELDSEAFEVTDDGCWWADGWDAERLTARLLRFTPHRYVPPSTAGHRTCARCGVGANGSVHRTT